MTVAVLQDFLAEAREFFEKMPEQAEQAAMLAINQTVERKAVPMLRNDIESQVAFPRGYLDQEDRLGVTRKATRGSLEAVITARDRPTSLARYAPGQTPESTRGKGVVVQVKRGRARVMKKAFLVRLANGNIGLAIRLKQGESIANKREMRAVQFDRGVYLLYGPSVDQLMKTVAAEALPQIGDALGKEFLRQFARLTRG